MKKLVIAVALALALLQASALAADITHNESGISVRGNELEANVETPVFLINPNKSIENVTEENFNQSISYAGLISTDAAGFYELDIALDNDCEYGLYTWVDADNETKFYYASMSEKQNALTAFSRNDAQAILSYLSDKERVYSIYGEVISDYEKYYDIISDEGKLLVCDAVKNFVPAGEIQTFAGIEDALPLFLSNFLRECKTAFDLYGFEALKPQLTEDNILEKLEEYNEVFAIDFSRLIENDTAFTSMLNSILQSKTTLTASQLRDLCYEQTAVYKVNLLDTHTAGNLIDIIEENRDLFGDVLSESGFSSLNNKNLKNIVMLAVADRSNYQTVAEINDQIISEVANVNSSGTIVPPSGHGNTSSGGRPAGGSAVTGGSSGMVQWNTGVNDTVENVVSTEERNIFSDLSDYDWAKEAIDSLYQRGIVNGIGGNLYAPARNITREEFLTMALKAFNIETNTEESVFGDVDNNAWYAPFVNTAKGLGIVNGISENEFGIGDNIIRQDAAVILDNLIKYSNSEQAVNQNEISFDDESDISDYAKEAVHNLVSMGIIRGYDNNMFMPGVNLNRAEAAVMLYAYIKGV